MKNTLEKNCNILINGLGGLGLTTAICLKILGIKNIAIFEKFISKKKFIQMFSKVILRLPYTK